MFNLRDFGGNDRNFLQFLMYSQGMLTVRYDRDANGNIVYEGYSVPGNATSAATWMVFKYEYDANHKVIAKKVGISEGQTSRDAFDFSKVWDDRVSLTYI